jgi:hypothetical protein
MFAAIFGLELSSSEALQFPETMDIQCIICMGELVTGDTRTFSCAALVRHGLVNLLWSISRS